MRKPLRDLAPQGALRGSSVGLWREGWRLGRRGLAVDPLIPRDGLWITLQGGEINQPGLLPVGVNGRVKEGVAQIGRAHV